MVMLIKSNDDLENDVSLLYRLSFKSFIVMRIVINTDCWLKIHIRFNIVDLMFFVILMCLLADL